MNPMDKKRTIGSIVKASIIKFSMVTAGIASVLISGGADATPTFAASTKTYMSVQYDGTWVGTNLTGMVVHHRPYIDATELSAPLLRSAHIRAVLTPKRWSWTFTSSRTARSIPHSSGSLPLYINGTRVMTLASVQFNGRRYVSIEGVIRALRSLGFVCTWDGYTLHVFNAVNASLLRTFHRVHPGWRIGAVVEAPLGNSGQSSLVVENNPKGEAGQDGSLVVSVLGPNRKVHDFKTTAWHPLTLTTLKFGNQSCVAAMGVNEDVDETLVVLGASSERPKVLATFTGNDGVTLWEQNGVPMVMTSTQLGGVPGNPSDMEVRRTVYQYARSSWIKTDEFTSGGFQFEPKLQTNPDVAAMTFLASFTSPSFLATAPLYQTSKTVRLEQKQLAAKLKSLPMQKPTLTFTMKAGTYGRARTYSTVAGKYRLFVTLNHHRGEWVITDFKMQSIHPIRHGK